MTRRQAARSLLALTVVPAFSYVNRNPIGEFLVNLQAWGSARNSAPSGGIDAREMDLWARVKRSWKPFRTRVDEFYRRG